MFRRKQLPRGIRHEVFKRDNYRCQECGLDKYRTIIHVDHIIPVSKGGTDEMSNLRTLCEQCNNEKSDLIHKGESALDVFFIPQGLDQFFWT